MKNTDINWTLYEQKTKHEIFDWLDVVASMISHGTVEHLRPQVAYERRSVLTDEIVTAVVDTIESYLQEEIDRYPLYHNTHQQIQPGEVLKSPGFDTLPMPAKRALVERYDEILQTARVPADRAAVDEAIAERQLDLGY